MIETTLLHARIERMAVMLWAMIGHDRPNDPSTPAMHWHAAAMLHGARLLLPLAPECTSLREDLDLLRAVLLQRLELDQQEVAA